MALPKSHLQNQFGAIIALFDKTHDDIQAIDALHRSEPR